MIGKVIAERAFADAARSSGRWDAITCRPGDNVGPILSRHQKERGPWQHQIETMLLGRYSQNVVGAYRPWYTVDVRDVAEAHIRMLERDGLENGERFIAWSTETRNVEDVCASIDRLLPELGFAGATLLIPCPKRSRRARLNFEQSGTAVNCETTVLKPPWVWNFARSTNPIRDCVESLITVGVKPVLK